MRRCCADVAELAEYVVDVAFDGLGGEEQPLETPALECPSAMSSRISRSRSVSCGEGAGVAAVSDQARDDGRVDHAFALTDTAERISEDPDVGDAVLEQIAGVAPDPSRSAIA